MSQLHNNRKWTTTEEADISGAYKEGDDTWLEVYDDFCEIRAEDGQDRGYIYAIGDNLYAGYAVSNIARVYHSDGLMHLLAVLREVVENSER